MTLFGVVNPRLIPNKGFSKKTINTYTVKRREPDVRFGKPDKIVSGYRIVRISVVRFIYSERSDLDVWFDFLRLS